MKCLRTAMRPLLHPTRRSLLQCLANASVTLGMQPLFSFTSSCRPHLLVEFGASVAVEVV
jgi:hypothetical protein